MAGRNGQTHFKQSPVLCEISRALDGNSDDPEDLERK